MIRICLKLSTVGKLYKNDYLHLFIVLFFLAGTMYFPVAAQIFPKDTIMNNGLRSNRINLVYLAEGFTSTELSVFSSKAHSINDALFNTVPFSQYKNFFNSFAVKVPSNGSGAIHPANATDETYTGSIPNQPIANPDNYFKTTFDAYNIHRLLVPQKDTAIYSVLAKNIPEYDEAFVIVNSPYYGGSGGIHSTASTNTSSTEIAIHELGHSFAGLADEYWAGASYAAEKPNMTANNNATSIKWKSWIGINNTGIYPHGSSGVAANWFKPNTGCKMQALGYPFCSVCTERFIDKIHQSVNMIDSHIPLNNSFVLTNTDSVSFSTASIQTIPNNIQEKWYVNNVLFASGVSSIKVPYTQFINGINTVKVEAIDNTILSKSYLPANGYIDAVTWTITKPSTLPSGLKSFNGKIKDKKAHLEWVIAPGSAISNFELLKSADGKKFSSIVAIPSGQNIENYSHVDANLLVPYSYYKLKMLDIDGSISYSGVVRLQNATDNYSYKIFQEAGLHAYLFTAVLPNASLVSLNISDAAGKIILKKDFGKVIDQLSYNFDLKNFPPGIYFLKLNINNSIYTSQLVAN